MAHYTPNPELWRRNSRLTTDNHRYAVDAVVVKHRVTSLVKAQFPLFDKHAALTNMKHKSAKYPGMSDNDILAQWDANSRESTFYGTCMHNAIEQYFLTGEFSKNAEIAPEMTQFKDFIDRVIRVHKITTIAVECPVFAEPRANEDIAGTFDFLGRDNNGDYCLMDWKRCAKLTRSANGHFGFGYKACARLENVNFVHYSLQLHVYRHILAKFYDISVRPDHIYIVVFHRNNSNYQLVLAHDYSAEVRVLFDTA